MHVMWVLTLDELLHLDVAQVVARCKEDILAAKGVKPTLSPSLNVLATVEALDVKRLLFIGVGCQVRPWGLKVHLCVAGM